MNEHNFYRELKMNIIKTITFYLFGIYAAYIKYIYFTNLLPIQHFNILNLIKIYLYIN